MSNQPDGLLDAPADEWTDDDSNEREDGCADAGNCLGPAQALDEERERREAHDVVREDAEIHKDDEDKVFCPQLWLRALRCICLCHRFLPLRAFATAQGHARRGERPFHQLDLRQKGHSLIHLHYTTQAGTGHEKPRACLKLPDATLTSAHPDTWADLA